MKFRKFRYVLFALCLISSLAALSLARLETEGTESRQWRRPSIQSHSLTTTAATSWLKKVVRRANTDLVYSNEDDEDTIEIAREDQDRMHKEASINCTNRIDSAYNESSSYIRLSKICPIHWDSVICWPEGSLNQTYSMPCPNYVDKFNRKNKAFKLCYFNQTLKMPTWSRTNFTMCLQLSQQVINDFNEIEIIEHHLKFIMTIRLCGYLISMLSLIFSIIILLRPKLRCPRNLVHVNLFLTFCLRTILIMIVDILRVKTSLFKMASKSSSANIITDGDKIYSVCRAVITLFRYSGSVFHTAITTEAIYLTLLLRFPYYSEKKGSRFSIITSWVLPLLWLVPWVFIRVFVESQWCWQVESLWNLLIEIPHTFLTIINVSSAVYIIWTLYSKMQRVDLNPEKVIKYKRLAKSILILVPIFGLHFIFFEWLPYVRAVNDNETLLELPLMYMEAFFMAFQGLMASIACCFIHLEARIEMLILLRRLLKRLKLLNTFEHIKCLRPEYVTKLRNSRENTPYGSYSQRSMSIGTMASSRHSRSQSQAFLEDAATSSPMLTTPTLTNKTLNVKKSAARRSTLAADSLAAENLTRARAESTTSSNADRQKASENRKQSIESNASFRRLCSCLFTTQKNDFYSSARRKSMTWSNEPGSRMSARLKPPRRKKSAAKKFSLNGSITTNGDVNESSTKLNLKQGNFLNIMTSDGKKRLSWSSSNRRSTELSSINKANSNTNDIKDEEKSGLNKNGAANSNGLEVRFLNSLGEILRSDKTSGAKTDKQQHDDN